MYATHIFDGLEGWLTHLAFVSHGKLLKGMLPIASSTQADGMFCSADLDYFAWS